MVAQRHGVVRTGNESAGLCGGKNRRRTLKMSVISIKQLLEAGVHFGHHTRRWNPKMQ
ncbi:MAG: 30S ribosomal protein S2, partial [Clostridia bacterium]|nr:30S ribosomal protein S2 [Clostridia bacterium]